MELTSWISRGILLTASDWLLVRSNALNSALISDSQFGFFSTDPEYVLHLTVQIRILTYNCCVDQMEVYNKFKDRERQCLQWLSDQYNSVSVLTFISYLSDMTKEEGLFLSLISFTIYTFVTSPDDG